jgi:hypothetical protein
MTGTFFSAFCPGVKGKTLKKTPFSLDSGRKKVIFKFYYFGIK